MTADYVEGLVSWSAMGLGVSIAAWIWPFRRGVAGLALNAVVAVAGAVALGLLARCLGIHTRDVAVKSLVFSAVGAIGALAVAHVVWARFTTRFPPRSRTTDRPYRPS